jgi:hypothetical protein
MSCLSEVETCLISNKTGRRFSRCLVIFTDHNGFRELGSRLLPDIGHPPTEFSSKGVATPESVLDPGSTASGIQG